jgi:hypothetical protein
LENLPAATICRFIFFQACASLAQLSQLAP